MRLFLMFQALALATVAIAVPAPASAQIFIGISVSTAPPALPYYDQPILDQPNEIWQPGYWQWSPEGYYWVPGTWVEAPDPGLLWTPGYWAFHNGLFYWQSGYWANDVGYYGGVDYGFGYSGNGYAGGSWSGRNFRYNTAVSRVDPRRVRYRYSNRNVMSRNTNRVSYNGGRGGLTARPTARQQSVARERHVPMTSAQIQHVNAARGNRNYLASVNHGRPTNAAVARPLRTAPARTGQQRMQTQRAAQQRTQTQRAAQQHVQTQ